MTTRATSTALKSSAHTHAQAASTKNARADSGDDVPVSGRNGSRRIVLGASGVIASLGYARQLLS